MNRRDLLTALPALAVSAPATAIAQEPESAIMRLFGEWQAARKREKDLWAVWDETPDADALGDALAKETARIEWEIIATPCQSARDFVAKVVSWTCNGELALPGKSEDAALWAEANELIGVRA